jgi:hypothetical protein
MPTSFPTTPIKEPLEALIKSIPEWQIILDDLNGSMAKRQIELAEAEDSRSPPRSIRNKGSTEALRPNDDDAISPLDIDVDTHPSHAAPPTRPLASPSSTSSPHLLRPSTSRSPQPVPRKRKTDSLASASSDKPKNRTRSMIIVYYDSAVQLAFEELVRHISASRNTMRKGKMAARMANMRKMAELEAEGDIAADAPPGSARAFDEMVIAAASPGDEDDDGVPLPALKFVSTRRMGPSRDFVASKHTNRGLLGVNGPTGVPRQAAQSASSAFANPGGAPGTGVFEDLDAGLEWCQSMCEHAAHQFLRDGQCVAEIRGIKGRLEKVRGRAEGEISGEDSREGEGEGEGEREGTPSPHPNPGQSDGNDTDDGRGLVGRGAEGVKGTQPRMLRPIQMRRPVERVEKAAEKGARKEIGETPAELATENPAPSPDQRIVRTLDVALEADADEDMRGEEALKGEYEALMARSRNSRYQRQ